MAPFDREPVGRTLGSMFPTPRRMLRSQAGLFFAGILCTVGIGQEPVAISRFTHPGAGQTFYFALTDRVANGDPTNDTGGIAGGREEHGFDPTDVGYYHGGDLAGITTRLDYLKNLGITAVWLTPPVRNNPVQDGSAAYHGYWITDYLNIDPHLGSNEDYRRFVDAAHSRSLRVFMDIVPNHTASIIRFESGTGYVTVAESPYRDADGQPFDVRAAAFNGIGNPKDFPSLSAERSFALKPTVPAAWVAVKNPAWLNDVTLYHNRGNSTFRGVSSIHGDFSGLDDVFTEHPRVVQGMIEIFSHWVREFGIDGVRIDTQKHVNGEFWQSFSPALRETARSIGRPDFLQFGEVFSAAGDPEFLSEFSTELPVDTTLDFGFAAAARRFIAEQGSSRVLAEFFAADDYYTDHDSNVHSTTTFLGNHDDGRWAFHLQRDNPDASRELLASLVRLGHGLLYLARGQPVLYYGDEQGMIGRGGNDKQARESMFASKAPDFRDAPLLGTARTGADDKFDTSHPFYQLFARLGALRASNRALRTGAMITRPLSERDAFAFSRVDRDELVEYLVVLNNSRTAALAPRVPTAQSPGSAFVRIFSSDDSAAQQLVADENGHVRAVLAPLQFAVWRAESPLGPAVMPTVALGTPAGGNVLEFSAREVDGQVFASRHEIRANVSEGDGVAEVTFAMRRASKPGQLDWLGTDDAPPYRIFWRPPPDLAPDETLEFIATVDDLRGNRATSSVAGITVAPGNIAFGIRGAHTPEITTGAPAAIRATDGERVELSIDAEGTVPLEFQWLRDGREIPGATGAAFSFAVAPGTAGTYRALVRNRAGTTISTPTLVTAGGSAARLEKHPEFPTRLVPPRQVDVWLPPGYDDADPRRYPVIYMQDGQNLFDPATSFGGVPWSIDESIERLIASGRTQGAIVVGIWNTGNGRFAEYMPRKPMTEDVMMRYGENLRVPLDQIQSDAYLQFLVTELKPFVDRTYRTQPEREHTFVMGSSMGGLISAYALVEYPEVFGGAGCVSTHWPAGEGGVIDYIAQHLPPSGTARLYFDHGTGTLDGSYEAHQRRLDALVRAAGWVEGRDWITRRFPGAEHSERYWRKRVDIPLAFLLGEGE